MLVLAFSLVLVFRISDMFVFAALTALSLELLLVLFVCNVTLSIVIILVVVMKSIDDSL